MSEVDTLGNCDRIIDLHANVMKSGSCGSALVWAITWRSVPVGSGLAGLLKPIWVSLICRKGERRRPARRGERCCFRAEQMGAWNASAERPEQACARPGAAVNGG